MSIIICNCLEVNGLATVPYQPMTRDHVPLESLGQNADVQSSLMSLQVGCTKEVVTCKNSNAQVTECEITVDEL